MGSITLNFSHSFLYLNLLHELNDCLKITHDAQASCEYIKINENSYQKFAKEIDYKNSEPPFSDLDRNIFLFQIIYSKMWDLFLQYLKSVLLISLSKNEKISKTAAEKVLAYKFDKIKNRLHEFELCDLNDHIWESITKTKKNRDKLVHQNKLNEILYKITTKSYTVPHNKTPTVTYTDICDAHKKILSLAEHIDKNLLRKQNPFSIFFQK